MSQNRSGGCWPAARARRRPETVDTARDQRPLVPVPGPAHAARVLPRRLLDLAAGLTYYAVLAVLPGLIAVISLLGVLGKGLESVASILGLARQVVPASALGILQPVVEGLIQTPRANLALVLGILGALWFVSGYVTAFGRVMTRSTTSARVARSGSCSR
jgi:uncharacterized BrkB/YihY/UPF0761 family membrane protein